MPPSEATSSDAESIVFALLEVVAEARDVAITDLPPIGEFFTPDALDEFLSSATTPTTVRLEVYGCLVELHEDGTVAVVDDCSGETSCYGR